MIEKEAAVQKDRPLIAGVIYNRLADGMPLGIDATLLYDDPTPDGELSTSDLETDTPYNTRMRTGLPPTPIASPYRWSLDAALNPADTPTSTTTCCAGSDGGHRFAKTYAEHLAQRRCLPLTTDRHGLDGGRSTRSGVIGWPVAHSLSPAIHNAAFADARDATGCTCPCPVAPGAAARRRSTASSRSGFAGANVTMPHKTRGRRARRRAVRGRHAASRAVEHARRRAVTELHGHNTDTPGFDRFLRRDAGFDPAGRSALVFGPGERRARAPWRSPALPSSRRSSWPCATRRRTASSGGRSKASRPRCERSRRAMRPRSPRRSRRERDPARAPTASGSRIPHVGPGDGSSSTSCTTPR